MNSATGAGKHEWLWPTEGQSITILSREPGVFVSTFFNEIVTCRLADGSVRRLLLKRGTSPSDSEGGHRGGPPYEADVYRKVLEPLGTSTPRFFASHTDPATGETTLLIDYIDPAKRLKYVECLVDAARWIGKFHRINEARVDALADVVKRYDSAYYLGWVRRTLEFSGDANRRWLPTLGCRFEALVGELLVASATVIHGEYYPHNILVSEGVIYPVDWESAAIAAGEIDLASLTEGWPNKDNRACEAEYRRARWPGGVPIEFERRLAIAKMYFLFRWLGDRSECPTVESAAKPFKRLRQLGEQLGDS